MQEASRQVRGNVSRNLQQNVKGSTILQLGWLLISLLKILLASLALSLKEPTCNRPLKLWICLMLTHDTFGVVARVWMIYALNKRRGPSRPNNGGGNNGDGPRDEEQSHQGYMVNDANNSPHVYYLHHEEEHDDATSYPEIALKVCRVFYFMLFVAGHVLYFDDKSDCKEVSKNIATVVLAFLVMGYIYLAIPLLIALALCLCLPFLFVVWIFFSRLQRRNTVVAILRRIKGKEYTPDIEVGECSICMVEFQAKDQITQLECSALHVYHTECLRQWVITGSNPSCPICRASIQ
eukprot:TRINITY_DN7159_c0_g1_i2.p2 TRINITY_DN7159_c0_g1~~TRINITY_DN7159_c0_g1_i2.p2  ORF type:complete len:293 (-),score=29.40 TRINITY_DN7159_c0_g1_i2:253-1131(-)